MELADPLILCGWILNAKGVTNDYSGLPTDQFHRGNSPRHRGSRVLEYSVVEEDPVTKESVARYKQLTLFNREDFVRVWKYWNRVECKAGWMKQELEKRYSAQFKGEKLTQHELFDKQEEQETVVIKPTKINPTSDNEKLRSKKPR